jgi:hypothetical protein
MIMADTPAASPVPTYSVKEFAWLFNRAPKTIRRLIAVGSIRVLPLGRPYQIPLSEYRRFANQSDSLKNA